MSNRNTLELTNMTAADVIPNTLNPAHDSRYWCVARMHDTASERMPGGSYPMYLVTQGRKVGIWNNWTAAEAMVTEYPSAGYRGHHTVEGCVQEWQAHCQLGVHPHPAAPAEPAAPDEQQGEDGALSLALAQLTIESPAAAATEAGSSMPSTSSDSSSDNSSPSSVTSERTSSASTVVLPQGGRYFAIWRGGVVHTERARARADFLVAEANGERPRALSTVIYDEAQAFSEGVYWVPD
ncbi:hypothetical protein B0H16DRAFT_1746637 [Mycena metata]|uniref:Ribonuclease H1 N-terminal domain-containing protein n=1 Tax=Mycena metata TaxID=1033252 RepID=A0AAD7GX77_9AGAR|nr:hypothetical protein B0H16DRAFT_1746637 [Mycena metata]